MKGTHMSIKKRSLLLSLVLSLSCAAAFAQGRINQLEIVVKDIGAQQDLTSVEPGGTVELERGGPVRLIMTATYANGKTIYPATRYSDQSRGGVNITRSNPDNATVDLDVGNGTGGREAIGFEIYDERIPVQMRRGTVYIRVGRSSGGHGGSAGGGWSGGSSRGAELTRMLYQAILLREPDRGARGTIESIDRDGYTALVRAAEGIADSDESRVRLYENGNVTNERRLISLYRNLLGLDPDDVNRSTWDRDLRRLRDGRIADVVSDMVRSERFRSRYRFDRR
jgi:hypothetical protein